MTDHDLLIRIDERTESIDKEFKRLNGTVVKIDTELHEPDGVCDRLTKEETKQKMNRALIYALWGVFLASASSILTFLLTKV